MTSPLVVAGFPPSGSSSCTVITSSIWGGELVWMNTPPRLMFWVCSRTNSRAVRKRTVNWVWKRWKPRGARISRASRAFSATSAPIRSRAPESMAMNCTQKPAGTGRSRAVAATTPTATSGLGLPGR